MLTGKGLILSDMSFSISISSVKDGLGLFVTGSDISVLVGLGEISLGIAAGSSAVSSTSAITSPGSIVSIVSLASTGVATATSSSTISSTLGSSGVTNFDSYFLA